MRRFRFIILVTAALWVGSASVWSGPNDALRPGYESYSSRPDVMSLQPRAHEELGRDWDRLKRAHLEEVAMLLEMYPDRELYFLARDAELLHDLARWTTRDEPETFKRLHLLNISRANMTAPHVMDYLAQEGISVAALKAGKMILFVDTGYDGSIPNAIQAGFPADLRSHFHTHLTISHNPAFPSTRVFLTAMNPAAADVRPDKMRQAILSYEHMPRYTNRSDEFALVHGKWEPVSSPKEQGMDGQVSREKAQRYMEDLLFESGRESFRTLFATRRAQWKKLKALSWSGNHSETKAVLKEWMAASRYDPMMEAMARDYIGMTHTMSVGEVGLRDAAPSGVILNRENLIAKYPEWEPALRDPSTGVRRLVERGEFAELGAIAHMINDYSFNTAMGTALGSLPTPGTRKFIEEHLDHGDQQFLEDLIKFTFSQTSAAPLKDLLRPLILRADQETLKKLLRAANDPGAKTLNIYEMPAELQLVIERADQANLNLIVRNLPRNSETKENFRRLIAKSDATNRRDLSFRLYDANDPSVFKYDTSEERVARLNGFLDKPPFDAMPVPEAVQPPEPVRATSPARCLSQGILGWLRR